MLTFFLFLLFAIYQCPCLLTASASIFRNEHKVDDSHYDAKNKSLVWTSAKELFTRFAIQRRPDGRPGGLISELVCPVTKSPHYLLALSTLEPISNGNKAHHGISHNLTSSFWLAQKLYESYARFEYWAQIPGSETNIDLNKGTFAGQWHSSSIFRCLLDELQRSNLDAGIRTTDIIAVAFSLPCGYSSHWIRDGVHRVSYIAATRGVDFRFPVTVMDYDQGDRGLSAHEDHWPAVEGITKDGICSAAPWIFYDFLPHNFLFL
mmetsp:Transcript_10282/g.15707  ORF Transcript_10282/g.15707 Transcript_10282/m.15707 type:complete len:263 (-) Transcript_10282:860-1648(-)